MQSGRCDDRAAFFGDPIASRIADYGALCPCIHDPRTSCVASGGSKRSLAGNTTTMSLFRCATHGARRFKSTANFVPPILTSRQGMALVRTALAIHTTGLRAHRVKVHDPLTNKGTGFPLAERDRLGIRGLVPPRQLPLDVQAEKIIAQVRQRPTDVEKHIFLASLQDRNETLFYRVLIDHIEELGIVSFRSLAALV